MQHHLLTLVAASTALASPVVTSAASASTGSLRVIAPNGAEVFPSSAGGAYSADAGPLQFSGSDATYRCDAGANAVTAGRAITLASRNGFWPFEVEGSFDASTGQPTFTKLAGQDVTADVATGKHFTEWINGVPATRGACADALQDGDRVVFAYARGDERILSVDLVSTGAICPRPTQLRVTDDATGQPVEGASVGDAVTDANGIVPRGATNGEPATKDGYIQSSPTVFAEPAILCNVSVTPIAPPTQPGTPDQRLPVPAKLTLKTASALAVGDLRFTAGSNRAVSAKLAIDVGGVTVKRALVFSKAGRKTFTFRTSAPQKRRLRRALARGPVRATATITGNGTSATASARLRG